MMLFYLWLGLVLVVPSQAHSKYHDPHEDPTFYINRLNFSSSYERDKRGGEPTHHLALELSAGEDQARALAEKYGLHYVSKVFNKPAVYHLHVPSGRHKRSLDSVVLVEALAREPGVRWVEQQKSLVRVKRRVPDILRYLDTPSTDLRSTSHTLSKHNTVASQRSRSIESFEKVLRRRLDKERKLMNFLSSRKDASVRDDDDLVDKTRHEMSNFEKSNVEKPPDSPHIMEGRVYDRRSYEAKGSSQELDFYVTDTARADEEDVRTIPDGWEDLEGTGLDFNDPYFKDQWYLHNTGQLGREGYDLNVIGSWRRGYTGRGVVLSVLDDGIQGNNADIAANYDKNISYSVVRDRENLEDANPRLDADFSNSHGTYCAGAMAAVSNNGVCGVGIAYDAKVGGVRLVDGTVTDIQEATALSRHIDTVDVFSASWGPTDNGKKVEGPAKLTHQAFLEGITQGRGGKGVIYVWASGNGGLEGDNCNLDGYVSSIYTLAVSALTDTGLSVFYGEPCAATLAGVFVGGEHTLEAALENRKKHQHDIHLVVPELDGHCSSSFQGTSAAAPLMAGIVALVLQANPKLTWRDVQHLVVRTALPTKEAAMEEGWETNALGKKFHLMQGYGAVDAGKLVENALSWENVGPQKIITHSMFNGYRPMHPYEWMNITEHLPTPEITQTEQIVANITLTHRERRSLTIFIISPSGTTSQVLTHRPNDDGRTGFIHWGFMSVHFWGEDPLGRWTVAIKDDAGIKGSLEKVELVIYGT